MRPLFFCNLLLLSPLLSGQSANPTALIEGDVTNAATNAPIASARLKLSGPNATEDPLYTKSDEAGHFHFADLKPARYRLEIEGIGYLRTSAQVDLTPPRPNPRAVVTPVRPAVPMSGLSAMSVAVSTDDLGTLRATAKAQLTQQAAISGKVTDPYGVPIIDCSVQVLAPRPQNSTLPSPFITKGNARVDDRGEFRIGNLEAGTYYIVADKQGTPFGWEGTFRSTYYPASLTADSAKPIELTAGQTFRADVQIVQRSGVRVAGKIVAPPGTEPAVATNGIPKRYTNVTLVVEGDQLMNNSSPFNSGQDEYSLTDVLPGRYKLMAASYPLQYGTTGGMPKPLFETLRDIEVGDHDILDADVVLQPVHDIHGVVKFRDGCSPVPVEVSLNGFSRLSGSPNRVRPGDGGQFVIGAPGPGHFTLNVTQVSNPGVPLRIDSVLMGDRDIQKAGFDSPTASDEPVTVVMGCSTRRVQ